MKKVETMKLVEDILKSDDDARNSDNVLILRFLERYGLDGMPIRQLLTDWNKYGLPSSFDGICRARRKVQQNDPTLRADERVLREREEREREFHDFYKW